MNENFGVGAVVGTSFRVFARNFIPFVLLAALTYSPIVVWKMAVMNGSLSYEPFKWGGSLLTLVLNAFTTATITYGVVKELQGQRASIGACIANGFKRVFPALGVVLLTWIAVFGASVLGLIGAGVVGLFGLVLAIPGVVVYCMLYVAVPASVLERPGVTGALRRSRELTYGFKGHVFGILLLFFVVLFLVSLIIAAVMHPDTLAGIQRRIYINFGVQILFNAFSSVLAAVTYASLRGDKEGTSANDLASVFE